CLVVNASKGLSAVQLSRDLDVQHKTAFVLMHKLREAMAAETRDAMLSGSVELDGAAFGGPIAPARQTGKRSSGLALCLWRRHADPQQLPGAAADPLGGQQARYSERLT